MIPRLLPEIELADLQALINNAIPESRTLEFKRELHGNNAEQSKECCYDFSAFANAIGGDMLFGLDEDPATHVAAALPGVDLATSENAIRTMENRLLAGVTPHMRVEFRAVEVGNGQCIIVARIPPSAHAPHMTVVGGANRFYVRDGSGKHMMDVGELRQVFTEQATRVERMRAFVHDRVRFIVERSADLPAELTERPKLITHFVPLQSYAYGNSIDLEDVSNAQSVFQRQPFPEGERQVVFRYDLDGIVYPSTTPVQQIFGNYYAQLFHDGVIEIVDEHPLHSDAQPPVLNHAYLENVLFTQVNWAERVYRRAQFQPPIFIFITLAGVLDYGLLPGRDAFGRQNVAQPLRLRRNIVSFPEIAMTQLDVYPPTLVKPILDQLWHGFGISRALTYSDEDGAYRGEWNNVLGDP